MIRIAKAGARWTICEGKRVHGFQWMEHRPILLAVRIRGTSIGSYADDLPLGIIQQLGREGSTFPVIVPDPFPDGSEIHPCHSNGIGCDQFIERC